MNRRCCPNRVGYYEWNICCVTHRARINGEGTPVIAGHTLCPKILECDYAIFDPSAASKLFGYFEETPISDSSIKERCAVIAKKPIPGKAEAVCQKMGIFSLEKLRSMDEVWFANLHKVRGVGPVVERTLRDAAGKTCLTMTDI